MWTRRLIPLIAAVLLAACAESAPEGADEGAAMSDEEAIAALGDYWETHYNMQHPDMVASRYTADAGTAPADGGFLEGREQVEAWLVEGTSTAPTAEVIPVETLVMGDDAVGMGRYTISTTGPDGNPMEFSGTYMNQLEKVDGEWKIQFSMTNYDSERPEGWEWRAMPEGDRPPDIENQFSSMIDAFETAWNAQDAAGVAALYADDSRAAFANGPILMGPDGVESGMADRMQPGVTLEIHQVNAEAIDDDHWTSAGWYEMQGPDGAAVQTGLWWNIVAMEADGSPKILWTLSNAFPMET